MATTPDLALAAEFPAASEELWRSLVDKVLKGADFDRKLVSRTYDGIEIQPLYTRGSSGSGDALPGSGNFTRGRHAAGAGPDGGWSIRQTHAHPDQNTANAQILEDLEGGVGSITLRLDVAGGLAGGGAQAGTVVASVTDLGAVLADVYLDLVTIVLDAGPAFHDAAGWLIALWDERGIAGDDRHGNLGADPIGAFAAGTLAGHLTAPLAQVAELATLTTAWPHVRAVEVDTAAAVDAGATEAEELAVALATGVAYLRALTDGANPLSLDDAARQIGFTLSADTDVFATIAKFRAARRLWAHALGAAGVVGDAAAPPVSARTSSRIMSQRDPWTNMLRTTAACFAAGAAGATAVTVQPFDAALGLPDDLARRIARNTQLILQEESHIAEVLDPAGGSYYLEHLTDDLTTRAWSRFQEIEAAGGIVAVLADGSQAAVLERQRAQRMADVATRKEPLTGVSEFPDIAETLLERQEVNATPASSGLPAVRLAAQFEALRDASDRHAASHGARPAIFLANLGPVATHTARATYAKNFFEAGGIATLGNDGFENDEALVAAWMASGVRTAVICSSDAVYAERAASTAAALVAAGCGRVYLAGNPGDQRAAYEGAGVTGFIHVGVDLVATLSDLHEYLEVAR